MRRAQEGSAAAFALLYDHYVDDVYAYVYHRVGQRHVAEDLVGDVFLNALRRIGTFRWQGVDFRAWLFTIARNRCRNELARRRPVAGAELPDVVDLRSPERAASEAELFRQLDAALDALPFAQRSAFVLSQLQGLSYEEVGRIEGVGVGTVKSRIARAREKLRCLLRHVAEPHS